MTISDTVHSDMTTGDTTATSAAAGGAAAGHRVASEEPPVNEPDGEGPDSGVRDRRDTDGRDTDGGVRDGGGTDSEAGDDAVTDALTTDAWRAPSDAPELVGALSPLLAAESLAEAAAAGVEPGDLEQAVWLRLLERLQDDGAPERPADWLRRAVRAEARQARRTVAREQRYTDEAHAPAQDPHASPERALLVAERRRVLRAAVRRTPGRCPSLLTAMLSPADPTYREIAGELGISQGSLGPMRSRCLGCLRRMLATEVPLLNSGERSGRPTGRTR